MSIRNFTEEFKSADFQLDGAHLIEASAGTGKTYNIQSLYARLIMKNGLRVSQILIMTYTDAATKELTDRLHTILQDVHARLCKPACPEEDEEKQEDEEKREDKEKQEERNKRADELIQQCLGDDADSRVKARVNTGIALMEFDQSAISTIHGFCQRVLSRYAFDAGINFCLEINNNKTAELNSLTEDWWRTHPDMSGEYNLFTLKKYVQALAGKPDHKVEHENSDILSIAQEIARKYEEKRPESPTVTYDDLLHFLRNALRPEKENPRSGPDFATDVVKNALRPENPRSGQLIRKLRQEFQAVLIDEFQDTDPVQYEIFERLFLNGNKNPLFFVGDPKQAVYAFRGGDIFTYLKAKNDTAYQYTLNVNYRSTTRIIDAVNAMFLDREGNPTFEHEQITYPSPGAIVEREPHVKGKILDKLDKPLRIIEFTPKKENPAITNDRFQIYEIMTEQILQILREKDESGNPVFSPSDIAILSNSNDRNIEIHQRLMKACIPSVVQKSGNVFSSPVAKELWLFLLAVANPMKKKALSCALTTAFSNMTLYNAKDWDNPDNMTKFVGYFNTLNQKWRSRPGLAALVAELEAEGYRKRLAERPDGIRDLADISQIWELCFSAVKQLGSSPEKLVNWLAERINTTADSEERADEYSRELETDEDAVRIMTIHSSKGLAARIVFLPDAWSLDKNQKKPYEFHDGGKGVFSLSAAAQATSKCEQDQEKIRLLYVAMTRAIERMILFTPPVDKIQDEPLHKLLNNLKERGGENPPYELIHASSASCTDKYDKPLQHVSTKEVKTPPAIKITQFKQSFSSLFCKSDKEDGSRDVDKNTEKSEAENEKEHRIFQLPGGTAIGTCWHDILEKVPFDADEEKIRKIAEEELTNDGLMKYDGILDATTEMIRKTLHFHFHAPNGDSFSLSDIPWPNRLSEQGFDVYYEKLDTAALKKILQKYWAGNPLKEIFLKMLTPDIQDRLFSEGFLNGFVDLIFKHGDYFYIIDWKSNSIGGKRENFTESGVCAEMAKHLYFFQYLLYSVILHFYLKQTLGSRYSWDKNFGGIRYCFLRGIAAEGEAPVFVDRPSEEMLEELGNAFGLKDGGKE